MCGGYTFIPGEGFLNRFEIAGHPYETLPRNFNVRPGAVMPVVIREDDKNYLMPMKWGLVPPWADDPDIGYRMINARAETIAEKASYRGPFRRSRCIVPASGFYDWKALAGGKTPYYFRSAPDDMLALAGLYEIAYTKDQSKLMTYTIITRDADETAKPIHDRMPVILDKKAESIWLDEEVKEAKLQQLLARDSGVELEVYEVSKKVNHAANNWPELINPV